MTRKLSFVATGAVISLLTLLGVSSAQDVAGGDGQHLNGSYTVTVFVDPPPGSPAGTPKIGPFTGLVTYHRDGTVIANEILNFAGTPLATADLTEDHGGWERVRNRTFHVSFVKMASLGGTFVAFIKNRATVELAPGGNEFRGRFRLDVIAPDGSIVLSGDGDISGVKIPVEGYPG